MCVCVCEVQSVLVSTATAFLEARQDCAGGSRCCGRTEDQEDQEDQEDGGPGEAGGRRSSTRRTQPATGES